MPTSLFDSIDQGRAVRAESRADFFSALLLEPVLIVHAPFFERGRVMAEVNRRQLVTSGLAAAGALAVGGLATAQEGAKDGLRVFELTDKILLYWWDWIYYGAHMHVDLYYYPDSGKFCYEGTLDYAGVVKIADGELCVVQNENGSFTVSGDCNIKIAGRKVASLDGSVVSRVDWNEGMWYLESYRFELCGTNTFELKCDTWEEDVRRDRVENARPQVLVLKSGVARDEDEKLRVIMSMFEARQGQIRPTIPPHRLLIGS